MELSEQWLREWVNPPIATEKLVEQLTLAGLEVESVKPVAGLFAHVVVGLIVDIAPHPQADRLRVCQVDVGEGDLLTIVCGGENARKGIKVAVAKIGATLPGDFKIKKAKLRTVESHGMLCSESELGLAEISSGIMELPLEAPIGLDLRTYLKLEDVSLDLSVTPNRGDCLSVLGVAREVAAINQLDLVSIDWAPVAAVLNETIAVTIEETGACSHYVGRIIRNVDPAAATPRWMQEKLRRSGMRSISTIVDITNFVLLELGQPLHAFNLEQVKNGINVRFAKDRELINLLDAQQLILTTQDLVIANEQGPVALAGIKGGNESGIKAETSDIFLESALFDPVVIAQTARKFGLYTEASHRFERGVDYALQQLAIERASHLICTIAGGEASKIIELGRPYQPRPSILLRRERIARVLGFKLADMEISAILTHLGMQVVKEDNHWLVTPPSYRYDIHSEIDLVEELARLKGYAHISPTPITADLHFLPLQETQLSISAVKRLLVDKGYQEAITYSFVDPAYEKKLAPQASALALLNPIASDLAVMRTNHWSGLLKAFQYNHHRQHTRVRLFETGLCFGHASGELKQSLRLGGLATGLLHKEQWAEAKRSVDFYDVKADLEAVLHLSRLTVNYGRLEHHPALHPGESAVILYQQTQIGCWGALHPTIAEEFNINQPVYLFDLDLEPIMAIALPTYEAVSKFPAVRRDIALLVRADLPAAKIRENILACGSELLKNVHIFDVYQGKGIDAGQKSIALSLFFQHTARTLVDAEVNACVQKVIASLQKEFNATLRD